MKKILFAISGMFSFLTVVIAPMTLAQDLKEAAGKMAEGAPITSIDQIYGILAKSREVRLYHLFIVAVIFIIIAAFYIPYRPRGDPSAITAAEAN